MHIPFCRNSDRLLDVDQAIESDLLAKARLDEVKIMGDAANLVELLVYNLIIANQVHKYQSHP